MRSHKGKVTIIIERLEFFEERYNVRFDALSAFQRQNESGDYYVEVSGIMYPRTGTSIDQDLDIVISLHDSEGKVIHLDINGVSKDDFSGSSQFKLLVYHVFVEPNQMKIYVRPT